MFGQEGETLAISVSIGVAVFIAVMFVLALLCGILAMLPDSGLIDAGGSHGESLRLLESFWV